MFSSCGFFFFLYGRPIGQAIIFLPCGFFWYLSSIFFRHLISTVADSMSTILPHIWCGLSANLRCRSETCCTRLAENTGRKKSPSGHHRTTLSGYIFTTGIRRQSGKSLLNSNISSIRPRNMLNFAPPPSGRDRFISLGHHNKFQRVSRLSSVTARHLVAVVSETLRR